MGTGHAGANRKPETTRVCVGELIMEHSIGVVLVILFATVLFLVIDVVRLDVVAIVCMLSLGWSGVISPEEVFSGFSSNAVIAMMAVMVLGHGISKTGIMDRFSRAVIKNTGVHKNRLLGTLSLSVGLLSGFIQNIGAAALFLPGVLNISRREKIPASALVMPIGFAAILGGTISMVGSGPLIITNDLLNNSGLEPYGLFSITPVGVLLLLSGICYFFILGDRVLPSRDQAETSRSEQEKLIEALNLPSYIRHYSIPTGSPLAGKTNELSEAWDRYGINVLGISRGNEAEYAPWRETLFAEGQELALLGKEEQIDKFASDNGLVILEPGDRLATLNDPVRAGFAEVIITPRSGMVGKTIRQFSLRKRYAVEPVILFSKGEEIRGDFSDHTIIPGDTLIVHALWEKIESLKDDSGFMVATPFVAQNQDRTGEWKALICFLCAIGLVLAGAPITIAFFSGAAAMVLTKVIAIQDVYQAIEWKVVFLIAGLIPLGTAMQNTGAAAFLADKVMILVHGGHPLLVVIAVAILATVFSLLMSNVGAIMVLAPLVMSMAQIGGLDPRPLTLLAAVCVSNSFVLPTHQVNAMMMSSGGYRNSDYIKAGGGMTLVFIVVAVSVFYFFFL